MVNIEGWLPLQGNCRKVWASPDNKYVLKVDTSYGEETRATVKQSLLEWQSWNVLKGTKVEKYFPKVLAYGEYKGKPAILTEFIKFEYPQKAERIYTEAEKLEKKLKSLFRFEGWFDTQPGRNTVIDINGNLKHIDFGMLQLEARR